MLVEIRSADRLGGKNAVDLPAALAPVLDTLSGAAPAGDQPGVDLSRLRLVADWVQADDPGSYLLTDYMAGR